MNDEITLRECSLIEAAERLTDLRRLTSRVSLPMATQATAQLEQARADLCTFALLFSAAMIRESGELGTEAWARTVERISNYTESLTVNVRQEHQSYAESTDPIPINASPDLSDSELARRGVEYAVDAALGEVARQQGGIADPTGREARGIGISAGKLYVRAIAERAASRRDG